MSGFEGSATSAKSGALTVHSDLPLAVYGLGLLYRFMVRAHCEDTLSGRHRFPEDLETFGEEILVGSRAPRRF